MSRTHEVLNSLTLKSHQRNNSYIGIFEEEQGEHQELQDQDIQGSPHKEESRLGGECRSRSPFSFPSKRSKNHGRNRDISRYKSSTMEVKNKLKNVRDNGEDDPLLWVPTNPTIVCSFLCPERYYRILSVALMPLGTEVFEVVESRTTALRGGTTSQAENNPAKTSITLAYELRFWWSWACFKAMKKLKVLTKITTQDQQKEILQIMERLKCQQGRRWNLQKIRTNKNTNIKNVKVDAYEFYFRWRRACNEYELKLRNSQIEKPNKNQKDDAKDEKVWALHEWCDLAYNPVS